MLEQLYTIVNTRYEDGRAVLLTTNLDARRATRLREQIGDRTVSRIYEICGDPLPMFGEDHAVLEPSGVAAAGGRRGRAGWEARRRAYGEQRRAVRSAS